ncbi:conserved membrane hypothetical protein [Flavobacterium sp. 9R]|uniref:hypothetical protein n=1 Tax=Flavobacterium sp. 9R TaxID=2653143 RepID=UPI0012F4700A|nr:hypothetical protein [Flavobacterium sp. 9R]VXC14480.1 conserved membrane hypothetical protein [Flavobacterium sp. 9R]
MIDFLIYFGYSVLILDSVLFAISFFKKEKVNGFFLIYLLFATIMQLSMEAFYHLHKNNLFLMNLFFIGQMMALGFFYGSLMNSRSQKTIIHTTMVLNAIIIGVQSLLDYEQFFKYNLLVIVITNLSVIVFAVLHLYNMLTSEKKYYYVTIGLILYLLASTLIYIVGNINVKLDNDFKFLLVYFNSFLLIVYYLFILYDCKVSFLGKKKR